MSDDRAALVALLHRGGARAPEALSALAALPVDEAVDALVEARFPQYAARAVEALGAALGEAFLRRADAPRARPNEAAVVLAGVAALRGLRGTALDARFDPLLAGQLTTWWGDEAHAIWWAALAALPVERREACVLRNGVGWRYLALCPTAAVVARAVDAASRHARDDEFPSAHHHAVHGLSSLGDAAAAPVARALRGAACTRAGRRVLTAALARVRGEDETLRACRDDPDALVRALARDGLDARHEALPPTVDLPPLALRARALRLTIDDAERGAMAAHLRASHRASQDEKRPFHEAWRARERPVHDPLRAFLALADAWLSDLRRGRWDPPTHLAELAMRQCLDVAADRTLAPWCLADVLSRVPPSQHDPYRVMHALLAAPADLVDEAAACLGETLSPEGCGNPLTLYGWLAARCPPVPASAPAFARGLVDPDPRLRAVCERVTGRRGAPDDEAWSLDALGRAFEPLRAGGYYGAFGVFAIDHRAESWLALPAAWIDPDASPDPMRAVDATMLALTLEGPLPPDAMPARMLAALAPEALRSPGPWTAATREAITEAMIGAVRGDRPDATQVEAAERVERLMSVVGASEAFRASYNVANVAWSVGWFFQGESQKFSALVVYENDQ